jgi:hypothetical protein
LRRIRRLRPSPALAVASLALFLALGGVGYAALNIPAGSQQTSFELATSNGQSVRLLLQAAFT